jgi:hypothetical protein
VADINTPIDVPWSASAKRGRVAGSAARRIACQDTARRTIDAHISAIASSTQAGLEASTDAATEFQPMRWTAR